ncbi:MAG: hypothetical protein LBG94_03910 [Treponema sp.]|jgi:hypothetical protein|nr:hypothetical protein [Treponema sp.]
MDKTKKPFIDYKTALMLECMYDFIMTANYFCERFNRELDNFEASIKLFRSALAPREKPEKWADALKHDHFDNLIADMRHTTWEMGLTDTLFEKLKDRKFRNRFTGLFPNLPVLENEIKDHYDTE